LVQEDDFHAENITFENSSGMGGSPDNRVNWSHQLSGLEAHVYTKQNILAPVLPVEPEVNDWTNISN
jgi:hypothetical protein